MPCHSWVSSFLPSATGCFFATGVPKRLPGAIFRKHFGTHMTSLYGRGRSSTTKRPSIAQIYGLHSTLWGLFEAHSGTLILADRLSWSPNLTSPAQPGPIIGASPRSAYVGRTQARCLEWVKAPYDTELLVITTYFVAGVLTRHWLGDYPRPMGHSSPESLGYGEGG